MSTPSGHDRITELLARPRRRGRRRLTRRRGLGWNDGGRGAITEQMALISAGCSTRFKLPTWDNAGTPLGVDVRRVVETTTTPVTNDVLGGLTTSRSHC
jgi:hypothetical protein